MAVKLGNGKWAVKENNLLAYNDNSGQFFNKEFDFTRGSSATYVGKDGLIKTAGLQDTNLVQNGDFSELGSELVTNGDFATDSDWVKNTNWSIGSGVATADGTTNDPLFQNGVVSSGKFYKVSFEVKEISQGSFYLDLGISTTGQYYSSVGAYTEYIQAGSVNDRVYIRCSGNTIGSIDNVSVKQVDPNDEWTLGTGWSYGEDKAVFDGGSDSNLSSAFSVTNGKSYKYSFTVSDMNNGALSFRLGSSSSNDLRVTSNGSYSGQAVSDGTVIRFRAESGFNGSVSNISVQEVQVNTPRIDFSDSADGALLLEPQSTNLVNYSEDFSGWILDNTTVVANSAVSPDGSLNADKIIATAINSSHSAFISLSSSTSSGTSYCYSFFAKAEEYTKTAIRIGGGGYSSQPMAVINLLNGSVISQQGFISLSVKDFSNGWYKINAVFTATSSVAPNIQPIADGFTTTSDNYTYNGDGTSGIYIWGAMFEQGSYATSYIPTQGGVVTRLADSCSQTFPDGVIGQTEGTVFLDTVINTDSNGLTRISLTQGQTTRDWIFFSAPEVNGGRARTRIFINNGGNLQTNLYGGFLTSGRHKFALSYKENDVVLYVDGVLDLSDNSALIPSTNSLFLTGSSSSSINAERFNKHNELKLYNTRLSNSELQALTTI